MSPKPEPTIWSCDTGQWIPCFDSCQLTITWMSNIKDVPMAMVLRSYFSRHSAWHALCRRTDIQTVVEANMFGMGY